MTENKTWNLTLNKYQRDNLLWLIGLIGWWGPKLGPGVEPFTFANTGDWVGEIGCMLNPEEGHGQPNFSVEQMIERINYWLKNKSKPQITFTTKRVKPLNELTAKDIPRGLDPEDVATDFGPCPDCLEDNGDPHVDMCPRTIEKNTYDAAPVREMTITEFRKNPKEAFEATNNGERVIVFEEDGSVAMRMSPEFNEPPWWEKALAGFTTRKDPLPDFTVGEEVDLLNPPTWAPGSKRVIITNMKLHEDGRIQCSWIDKKGGCGGAPSDSFRKICCPKCQGTNLIWIDDVRPNCKDCNNKTEKVKACPCLHTAPCSERCTCTNGGSSVGCQRCCTYGSPEQQAAKAEFLVSLFDKSRLELANEVLKAQEARKNEDIDAWAERLANEIMNIPEPEYILAYDAKEVGQFTCPDCGRDHSGISCEMQDECGIPRFPKRAALAAERRDKIVAVQQMVGKFIDEHPHMKNDFGDLERLIWEAKGGYPAKSFVCTCGSGGHPRHCKEHPDAYDKHVAEINATNALEELEAFGEDGCCPICLEHGRHGDVWDDEYRGVIECPVGKLKENFNKMTGVK